MALSKERASGALRADWLLGGVMLTDAKEAVAATALGSVFEDHFHPGALVGSSRRESMRSTLSVRSKRVMENPGILRLVYTNVSLFHAYGRDGQTMNDPARTRNVLIPRLSSALFTSPTMAPSSSSLRPPRLFTRRTTRSVPSLMKGTKDRSGSAVDVIIWMRSGMSWLSGGTGEMRRWPLSLWIPSPISSSFGPRKVSGTAVPGT